ncbi:MAG: LysR family transcriptional regulator [Desulfovibrio sp.]|jgi:DNA-binding transcriptional LysR family regulator|nr:LysR family transcriptional regulator [Desulfovibrio sp.]
MLKKVNGDFLEWLRGFHHVVTCGSVAAASLAMGIKQPTVSRQVRMLEKELGVQLFQRVQRKMTPTPEGMLLYERANRLFADVREIRTEIGRKREEEVTGEVSLATTHSVAGIYLPAVIKSFTDANRGIFFTILGTTETSLILDKVQSSDVELGIALGPQFPPTIESWPLFSSRLVLIAPKNPVQEGMFSFARNKNGELAELRDLDGMPYTAFSPHAAMTHYMNAILARYNIKVIVTARVNTSTLLVAYVSAGFGVSILDEFTALAHENKLDIYPLPEIVAPRAYHLIYRKRTYLSPQSQAFIRHLRGADSS